MGVAFYTIGFATAVQTTFFPDAESPAWIVRGIGSAGLFCVLLISVAGAEFFSRFNVMFFAVSLHTRRLFMHEERRGVDWVDSEIAIGGL